MRELHQKSVRKNLAALFGGRSAKVLLSSERAVVEFDPEQATLANLWRAVADAGYRVPVEGAASSSTAGSELSRGVLRILGGIVAHRSRDRRGGRVAGPVRGRDEPRPLARLHRRLRLARVTQRRPSDAQGAG